MTDLSSLTLRRLRAWIRLLRFVRGAESQLREFLRINFDTTLPRFDVAAALYRVNKPVRMSELSKMLLVSNGNVTTVVDRLEKEGKARRIADETDKRVVSVELTEGGRNWFKDVAAA
ncbi:MAG: MarR family winged helix-turn-helix transcriptional regulator, partial [Paracoccaceae bacterium]